MKALSENDVNSYVDENLSEWILINGELNREFFFEIFPPPKPRIRLQVVAPAAWNYDEQKSLSLDQVISIRDFLTTCIERMQGPTPDNPPTKEDPSE